MAASKTESMAYMRSGCLAMSPARKIEELPEHRGVIFGLCGAGYHYSTVRADCVVNLVTLTLLERTANGLRNRCLIAVRER